MSASSPIDTSASRPLISPTDHQSIELATSLPSSTRSSSASTSSASAPSPPPTYATTSSGDDKTRTDLGEEFGRDEGYFTTTDKTVFINLEKIKETPICSDENDSDVEATAGEKITTPIYRKHSPKKSSPTKSASSRRSTGTNNSKHNGTSSDGTASPARMATSLEDISSLRFWKGIVAEFVGTLLLTMVGCGSCINLRGDDNKTSPVVQIALCFGLSVGTIVWAIAHISGGHINPAVTVAMLATRKISMAKAVFYILSQLIGAVVGAGILMGLTPQEYHGPLGMTTVNSKISVGQAVGVELFITFVLVFTVFASCDSKRKDLNGSVPLTIGLSVTMCHLWAIDYTGSSMNTARSFGPALVMGEWDAHWVYWVGPLCGGLLAGVLYEHLFAANATLMKAKACLLSSDYDDEKYKAGTIKVRIIEEDAGDDEGDNEDDDKDSRYSSKHSNI